jgi:Meckel syndrome type 1 protein
LRSADTADGADAAQTGAEPTLGDGAAVADLSLGGAGSGGDGADAQTAALAGATGPLSAPQEAPAEASGAGGTSAAADLAAQMAQKIAAPSTRFDLELNPAGLGKVAVAVEISAAGVMRASLSFEKSQSASLLSGHAAALQQSLAQAGVSLSASDLSFTTASASAFGGASTGGQTDGGSQNADSGARRAGGRAFGAAAALEQAEPSSQRALGVSASGLDIRI